MCDQDVFLKDYIATLSNAQEPANEKKMVNDAELN